MSFLTSLTFTNSSKDPIKLILEPWAEEYNIAGGMKVNIVAENSTESSMEVEYEKENIIVYGWADSMTVLFEGKKLDPTFD